MRGVRTKLAVFARRFYNDQKGVVSLLFLIIVPAILGMAGLAEVAIVHHVRAQLQYTADIAALSAAQSLPDLQRARADATRMVTVNMNPAKHGDVMPSDDLIFGSWDRETGTFVPDPDANAVAVTLSRNEANGNPLELRLMSLFSTDSVDITAQAVAAVEKEDLCSQLEDFAPGTVIADQITGMTVQAVGGANQAMVFDTANPTGGDHDLASDTRGNVLIISEDGDSSDPDDNARGGSFVFTFEEPAFIGTLIALDTEDGGQMTAFNDLGTVISSVPIPELPDGTEALVAMDVGGVSTLEVRMDGSGAFDDLCFGVSTSRAWLAR